MAQRMRVLYTRAVTRAGSKGGADSLTGMYVDVTDETFQAEVIDRSATVPVVVDLWAPWCGPCRTLGPFIEKVIDDTDGQVVLVKVNVDENPASPAPFKCSRSHWWSRLKDGQPVDGFLGAAG